MTSASSTQRTISIVFRVSVGQPIEAQVRFLLSGGFAAVGKFDFLPIIAEEAQLQLKNDFSYLFGCTRRQVRCGLLRRRPEAALRWFA